MVEVDGDGILLDFDDSGIEATSIFAHHRHNGAFVDALGIEFVIDEEYLLVNIKHEFILKFAVGIIAWNDEVKAVALG